MIANLSQKLELHFWDLVIIMLTGSRPVQRIVGAALRLYQDEVLMKKVATVFVIACAGFATGILAFTVSAFF